MIDDHDQPHLEHLAGCVDVTTGPKDARSLVGFPTRRKKRAGAAASRWVPSCIRSPSSP